MIASVTRCDSPVAVTESSTSPAVQNSFAILPAEVLQQLRDVQTGRRWLLQRMLMALCGAGHPLVASRRPLTRVVCLLRRADAAEPLADVVARVAARSCV